MPVIKPRTRGKQFVRHTTRLDRENNETLYAYGDFISEPPEYILNQLIEQVLAKDKAFASWRAEHPQSFVTRAVDRRGKAARRSTAAAARERIADTPTTALSATAANRA